MRKILLILILFLLVSGLCGYDPGKKPLKAMALSLAIPGGGQFYNESYYKAAFVLALEGYFIGRTIYHHDRVNHYRDLADTTTGEEHDFYLDEFNRYYRRRQNDYWWLGTIVFLSVVDAFVDANLYNYNQEKERVNILFGFNRVGIKINFY